MTGAALLAGRSGLAGGAGRVYVSLLDQHPPLDCDPVHPELMFRRPDAWQAPDVLESATVVCGCGGGDAVRLLLPEVLARARRLVLDADGLNAVAADGGLQDALRARADRGLVTVLTPTPGGRAPGRPQQQRDPGRPHRPCPGAGRAAARRGAAQGFRHGGGHAHG